MSPYLIDTHCHLDFPPLDKNPALAVSLAYEQGVHKVITIGTSLRASRKAIEIASSFPNVFATVGIHPSEDASEISLPLQKSFASLQADLLELAQKEKVVAIGECGLDYFHHEHNSNYKSLQSELFKINIRVAQRLHLPLVVHSREAFQDTVNILEEMQFPFSKTVFHCFTYNFSYAEKLLKRGSFLSFTGIVTYKNASEVQETASQIPDSRFFLETDAPFLAPQEKRGLPNTPAYLPFIAEKIATLRQENLNDLITKTSLNAERFFQIS